MNYAGGTPRNIFDETGRTSQPNIQYGGPTQKPLDALAQSIRQPVAATSTMQPPKFGSMTSGMNPWNAIKMKPKGRLGFGF
jgi:hypothetical protein